MFEYGFTTQQVFFRELNSTSFNWFWAFNYECVHGFFPAGFWDNPQWIFQKHWTCPGASKRDYNVFYEFQSIRDFLGIESSFQNGF
jgi:hypothetical protein